MSIPIPPDMVTGTVTWRLGREQGGASLAGVSGVVTFAPTAVAVHYTSVTVLPAARTVPVTAGVMTPTALPVNEPGIWAWTVTPRLGVAWEPFTIDVAAEGVDLAHAAITPGTGPVRTVQGPPGLGAYEEALAEGFQGTRQQWLASLKGDGSAWSAITGKPDAFPPAGHSHVVGDVTGLTDRLAALEYDSGVRNITGTVGATSGELLLLRQGKTVWLRFLDLVVPEQGTTWASFPSLIPPGFRVVTNGFTYQPLSTPSSPYTPGPFRTDRGGSVLVYGVSGGKRMSGLVSWPTSDPIPMTLPGTPG